MLVKLGPFNTHIFKTKYISVQKHFNALVSGHRKLNGGLNCCNKRKHGTKPHSRNIQGKKKYMIFFFFSFYGKLGSADRKSEKINNTGLSSPGIRCQNWYIFLRHSKNDSVTNDSLQTNLLTKNCSIGQRACNSLCINSIFICMKAATLWWGRGEGQTYK